MLQRPPCLHRDSQGRPEPVFQCSRHSLTCSYTTHGLGRDGISLCGLLNPRVPAQLCLCECRGSIPPSSVHGAREMAFETAPVSLPATTCESRVPLTGCNKHRRGLQSLGCSFKSVADWRWAGISSAPGCDGARWRDDISNQHSADLGKCACVLACGVPCDLPGGRRALFPWTTSGCAGSIGALRARPADVRPRPHTSSFSEWCFAGVRAVPMDSCAVTPFSAGEDGRDPLAEFLCPSSRLRA